MSVPQNGEPPRKSNNGIKIVVIVVAVIIALSGLYGAGIFNGKSTSQSRTTSSIASTTSSTTSTKSSTSTTSTSFQGTGDSIEVTNSSFSNGGLVLDLTNNGGVATTNLSVISICTPDYSTCSQGSGGYPTFATVSPFNISPGKSTVLNISKDQWPDGLPLFAYSGSLASPLQNEKINYVVQVSYADGNKKTLQVEVPWTQPSLVSSVSSAKLLLFSDGNGSLSISLTLNDTSSVYVSGVTLYSGSIINTPDNRTYYLGNDDFDLTPSCQNSSCPKNETLSTTFVIAACCDPLITAGIWYLASVSLVQSSHSSQVAFWIQAQNGS